MSNKQEWETLPDVAKVQLYVMGLIEDLIDMQMMSVEGDRERMTPKGRNSYQQMRAASFHPSVSHVEQTAAFLTDDQLVTLLIKTWYEKEILEKEWPDEI